MTDPVAVHPETVAAPPPSASLGNSLHIGIGWLPEQDGGLNRVYFELINHLPPTGVGTLGLVQGSARVAQETGGRVRAFAPFTASLVSRLRGLRRSAREMLQEFDVPLVVSHFALYAFPALDLLRERPFVVHFQGPWAQESAMEGERALTVRAKKWLEQRVYGSADRFIVLSTAFHDVLRDSYGVPEDRIEIVPCGVDVDHFATGLTPAEARERLGWPQDRPIVFCVRRLVHRMGLENLITAFDEVRRQVPDALLMIAGKGPLAPALSDQIRASGLENHVRLLGFIPESDLPLSYRAANVTIVPTVALEGMGCITLESMAAGTPVLVTPVGGLPEAVQGLSTDLILPDATVGSLVEGLTGALRGRLILPGTEACQAYVRSTFDWPIIAAQVRDVYAHAMR